ncbi:hypothetical protein SAMN05444287_2572 [Octadecabacter temperatus]|uniref:Uncharacterized protein n=1 Tax=Octadecabacter temperatus TaxID=1458307 RepID=A0A0K0YA25_9RHOB|nr:hypothetical protein OSB_32580 [Octadecabacter temperatus]SIO38693.1 hypothetical protein SAMN05444287_2572 [Octadecabacter temperatus]
MLSHISQETVIPLDGAGERAIFHLAAADAAFN